MKQENWRCYICGEPIGVTFVLFSYSEETDRVFLGHEACAKRIDGPVFTITVTREKP
jgi:hypothetical protein